MANMQDMLGKTPEQMEIARRYRMADVLRKQADEPTQGQMVSGHYVAPSWTQHLSKILSGYGAGKMERDAAESAKKYGEQQRTDFTDTAAKYAEALRGTPEQQAPYQADNPFGEDLGNLQTVTPGTPGDPNQALAVAMQSRSPQWQQFGMQQTMEQAAPARPTEYGTTPFVDAEGNAHLVGKTGETKALPFKGAQKEGANPYGQDLREWFAVNGIDPRTATPEQLQAGYAHVSQMKDSRAPRTSVTVGPTRVENITTQESEGSKVYGRGLGEMQVEIQRAGFTAPSTIANLDRMASLLEGVDSGKLAGTGLEVAKFAKSFGIEIDPKLGNKQAAESLAIEMALKMRPVGSGPMTDKDFDRFLDTVPSLAKTAEGRKQITATMKAKARRDMEIAKMTRDYAKKNRGVVDDNFLDQVADYMAKNPVVPIAQDFGGGWKMEKVGK